MIEKLQNIQPGETLVYYTGFTPKMMANDTFRMAMSLYEMGRVILVQRRHDDGKFDYLAIGMRYARL